MHPIFAVFVPGRRSEATRNGEARRMRPGGGGYLLAIALAGVAATGGTLSVYSAVPLTPMQLAADKEYVRCANSGSAVVWRKPLPEGALLVALANHDTTSVREITVHWVDLGLSSSVHALLTDANGEQTLGRFVTSYTARVKPESVHLVRILPDKPAQAAPGRSPTAATIAGISKKPINPRRLNLAASGTTGTMSESAYAGRPDGAGVLERFAVDLPAYTGGCYFGDNFPIMGNTTGPRVFGDSLAGLSYGGLFMLLQLGNGGYLAVVPVSGTQAFSWFEPSAEGLILGVGTRGTAEVRGDLPLLAWSTSEDAYKACAKAWEAALKMEQVRGNGALRGDKKFPEYFNYLGWCSWEQFRHNISEDVLGTAFSNIKASGLPVRWALIDDGHVANRDNQFTSFRPNENFPNGFAPLLAKGRQNGIRWFGLWQYMSGYGGLIAPDNDLGLDQHLREVYISRGQRVIPARLPGVGRDSAQAFFSGLILPARQAGFDFVKVDFQGYHFNYYTGTENAVATAQLHYQLVEQICHEAGLGLHNCLSMNHLRVFNSRHSVVMRSSRDYRKDGDAWNKEQTWRAFHNALWLGQTMWLDHDMAHSSDQVAGRMLSVAKALSGGPVYLSDDPRFFYAPNVRPLAFETGELLRPLAPATPLPASLFADPLQTAVAYQVISPLAGGAAAVGLFNLTLRETPVEARLTPADYRVASALIQPYPGAWPVPDEGLLVFDWESGRAQRLGTEYRTTVPNYSSRLLLLCPIRNGWAVIGRTDKYLSPAATEVIASDGRSLTLSLKESGPLAVWSATGQIHSEDAEFVDAGGGLWRAAYATNRDGRIRITRR